MATLRVPDQQISLTDEGAIRRFLDERGIFCERRPTEGRQAGATDTDVLATHNHWLIPFMAKHGYRTADVIRVTPQTPNVSAIREKFFREHTHSEDEVRFFVTGQGLFWFHLEKPTEQVFALDCEAGDILSVPANTKHWFDLGTEPHVCAIRIFTDQAGWVPYYTSSGIEERYR